MRIMLGKPRPRSGESSPAGFEVVRDRNKPAGDRNGICRGPRARDQVPNGETQGDAEDRTADELTASVRHTVPLIRPAIPLADRETRET